MRRTVILTVDDDRASDVYVVEREHLNLSDRLPPLRDLICKVAKVPPDNQLTRDLDEVTRSTINSLRHQEGELGHDGFALWDMALRLRAAAGLEET